MIVTCEMLPLAGVPVRGGGLRVWGLGEGLKAHGHEVRYSLPREAVPEGYELPEDLRELLHEPESLNDIILQVMPDVVIVEQWGLASYVDDLQIPLAIDLHGPLSLENAFKEGGDFLSDAHTKIDALAKADLLICPGEFQKQYFLTWFLLAGASPHDAPIEVVPVSLGDALPDHRAPQSPRFVFGGVTWPWIDPFPGLESLAKRVAAHESATLDLYVGAPTVDYQHRLYAINKNIFRDYRDRLADLERVTIHDFIPRDELLEVYAEASVAFDLYQPNAERQLAFTTRTVEYLWCGLPVIYGDYGELAAPLREYDAGWVVDPGDPAALEAVLDEIFGDPEVVARKSANAQKLAAALFTWERAVTPLARFVDAPRRREKKSSLLSGFRDYFRRESVQQILDAKNDVAELNSELRRASTQAEEDRRERDKKIQELSEEIKNLIVQHDEALRRQADLHRAEVGRKEDDLRRQQDKLDEEVAKRDKQTEELRHEKKTEADRAQEEIKQLGREKETQRAKHEDKVAELVKKQEAELDRLKIQHAEQATEYQRRLTREGERREDLEKELQAEIKRLNLKLEGLYEERDRRETKLQEELAALQTEIRTLSPMVEQRDRQLAAAEAKLAQTSEKATELEKELEVKLADAAALTAERDALQEEIAAKLIDLERAIFDKEHYIDEAEKRFADVEDRLAKAAHEIQIMAGARDQALADIERHQAALADRVAEVDRLRADFEALQRHARNLEGDNAAMNKRNALLERLVADFEDDPANRRKMRRGARLTRWLVQLPSLAILFAVNLGANAYMKIRERRTGQKIFPGT
ncbi:MAG: glycosyltransferase [Candidatus Lernaella stagnicola]|nr:glycosyltransferase [Candidatus Lernaella stagnicola]